MDDYVNSAEMVSDPGHNLTLVVVDDHEFAREAVAAMLDAEPGLKIVGQASRVWEARELIARVKPDVAVVDLNMPDGSGRELVEHFAIEQPDLRCVIFTSSVGRAEAHELIETGADAVVLKSLRGTDLVDAIRRVRTGDSSHNAGS